MSGRMIKYTVNSAAGCGVFNGFSDTDEAVRSILREAYGGYCYELLRDVHSLTYTQEVKSACMPYYRPYPVMEFWDEELKARVRRMIDEKSAEGVCPVPYELARQLILGATRDRAHCIVEADVKRLERELTACEAQRRIGRFSDTSEEACLKAYRYNEMNNQGGFGYVPHFYSAQEEKSMKEKLEVARELLGRIEINSEMDANI